MTGDGGGAEMIRFYGTGGVITDPGPARPLLNGLPSGVGELVEVVQGLVLHMHWAQRYGVSLTEERRAEAGLRSVAKLLERTAELDGRPLPVARPVDRKIVGTCRDLTVLLCALLHHAGVPARARCGFGTYFVPDHFEDHWVAEVWDPDRSGWRMVDAQLDTLQREELGIDFDPLDVPADRFITAGRAWRLCQAGEADPDSFGIFEWHGEWFVADNLIRDFLALNKVEILPWDGWALMPPPGQATVGDADRPTFDRMAELATAGDAAWPELRSLFAADPRLHTLPEWLASPTPPFPSA